MVKSRSWSARGLFVQNRWILAIISATVILFFGGLLIGHYAIGGISSCCDETDRAGTGLTTDQIRQYMFNEIKPNNIKEYLKTMTKVSHPAGTPENNNVVKYIEKSFQDSLGGENVKEASYDGLLSRVNLTHPNNAAVLNADGTSFLTLRNKEDPDGQYDAAFFAYSPQGEITSKSLIYVNEAREEDFEYILQNTTLNSKLNGSIVLARYGGFRDDQVEISAKYGAAGILLFLDPSMVARNGTLDTQVYPSTAWMPPMAISRGSIFLGRGDSLSQGQGYRTLKDAKLPKIPAVPIGYGDAQKLFEIMGPELSPPISWCPFNYLTYSLGGQLSDDREVSIKVTNYMENSRITNVLATVPGCQEADRYVIVGNHFDAWTYGGIDPNSDSWCPRRTIIFGAWDAEEYSMVGSTEWVEENLQILHDRAVAYINIDAAVRGQMSFSAIAMPLLKDAIYAATKLVTDPVSNKADLRYNGLVPNPAYHTAFETFEYVDQFVDPTFLYHAAITKVWGELVRDLADSVIIPFSVLPLSDYMIKSWRQTQNYLKAFPGLNLTNELDLESINLFERNAKLLAEHLKSSGIDKRSSSDLSAHVRSLNDRLFKIDRMFLDPNGLPGRPLERHILQTPNKFNSYASSSFPGIVDCAEFIRDAVKTGNYPGETYWRNELKLHYVKVTQMIDRAARFLVTPSESLSQSAVLLQMQ